MGANYFKIIRKSYIVNILFSSVLSNLVVFGQPLEEIIFKQHSEKIVLERTIAQNSNKPVYNLNPVAKKIVNTSQIANTTHVVNNSTISSVFYANEKQGVIGKLTAVDAENPIDNFFSFSLPDGVNLDRYNAVLLYDVYGVANATHTTKSINSNLSYGGKAIVTTNEWAEVKEKIVASQLKPGTNEIFFNRRAEENYQYKVRNLRIELIEKTEDGISLMEKSATNFNGNLYIMGTVSNPEIKNIKILGQEIISNNGVFEQLFTNIPKNTKELEFTYELENTKYNAKFPVHYKPENTNFEFNNSALQSGSNLYNLKNLSLDGIAYSALTVVVKDEKQLLNNTASIIVEGLKFKDLRTLNADIENVTAGDFSGYRVNKISVPDSTSMQFRLKYNPDMIPDGYTAKDIRTMYFDKIQRSWKVLPIDSLDYEKKEIISTIYNNDTDFINGVIKVPESPETGSFAPTTITDMKYADPGAGIIAIQPPTPNNTGAASTSFPLKLPQGRNGMQPSLQVTYNSEAGNGWMGIGWNLTTPAITLNTKWGVPLFGAHESEIYSMDGSDLVLNAGNEENPVYTNPHRQAGIQRGSERIFYQRKEGSYLKIIRHGGSTSTYWWEVIDKQGNKSFYGGHTAVDNNAVIRTPENHIVHWALKMTIDPYGNYVIYDYADDQFGVSNSNTYAKEFYINKIRYTMHTSTGNSGAYYEVNFKRNSYTGDNTVISRKDVIVNGRNGYLQGVNDLLTEVHIAYINGEINPVRSYRFDYKEMAFQKQQLVKISEFDVAGNLFYSNTLEYYNETGQGIFPSQTSWSGDHDDIFSPLEAIAGNIPEVPNGSLLGTSVSTGFSVGFRLGIGPGVNVTSVSNTAGGSGSYSQNSQNTRISLIDINGDGLPDKLYDSGSDVKYRPNNGQGFDSLIRVEGLNSLSKTKSSTWGYGFDVNALGLIGVGKSSSETTSETDNFFADFNEMDCLML